MTNNNVSWWHRTDGVALGFGVFFVGLAALWLLSQLVSMDLSTAGWALAVCLVVAGAAGIVTTLVRHAGHLER